MQSQQRCISLVDNKFLVLVLVAISQAPYALSQKPQNPLLSAVFVFGDSTVDSGNNNHLLTNTKSNFPPYGKDLPDHIPTGRFSNGKLTPDLFATYLGIKEFVPAYLDKTVSLEEMKTGVCFASAGSGFDPLTPQLVNVLSMEKQLENFREYIARLHLSIGKLETDNIIKNAAFMISAGTNDILWTYYGAHPNRRQQYNISAYNNFLLQHVQQFIQELVLVGARKILLIGLPPLGCLPVVITLYHPNDPIIDRQCVEFFTSAARDFNSIVRKNVAAMQLLPQLGAKVYFSDVLDTLEDMAKNPIRYGFLKGNVGCCGSGLREFGETCHAGIGICPDDSKYVFFDAVHPTEAAYRLLLKIGFARILLHL